MGKFPYRILTRLIYSASQLFLLTCDSTELTAAATEVNAEDFCFNLRQLGPNNTVELTQTVKSAPTLQCWVPGLVDSSAACQVAATWQYNLVALLGIAVIESTQRCHSLSHKRLRFRPWPKTIHIEVWIYSLSKHFLSPNRHEYQQPVS